MRLGAGLGELFWALFWAAHPRGFTLRGSSRGFRPNGDRGRKHNHILIFCNTNLGTLESYNVGLATTLFHNNCNISKNANFPLYLENES